LFNVKALENDFSKIKLDLQDRIIKKEKDDLTRRNNFDIRENFEAIDFVNEFDTYSDAIQDPRFQGFSNTKKDKIFDTFEKQEIGFDSQTDPRIEPQINKLLKENNFDGALDLLQKNISNVTHSFYNAQIANIKSFKFTGKDGLLADEQFLFYKGQIEILTKKATSGKFNYAQLSELEADKFETKMRRWLDENKLNNFNNSTTERESAFEDYVQKEYQKFRQRVLDARPNFEDGNVTFSNEPNSTPILVNPDEIPE